MLSVSKFKAETVDAVYYHYYLLQHTSLFISNYANKPILSVNTSIVQPT